jgi:mRNA interferase RelE/StbE
MAYRLEVLDAAARVLVELARTDKKLAVQIRTKIDTLIQDPRPSGCVKLKGRDDWRVEPADFEVVPRIECRPSVLDHVGFVVPDEIVPGHAHRALRAFDPHVFHQNVPFLMKVTINFWHRLQFTNRHEAIATVRVPTLPHTAVNRWPVL